MEEEKGVEPNWAQIPNEYWAMLVSRISSVSDVCRCGAVCKRVRALIHCFFWREVRSIDVQLDEQHFSNQSISLTLKSGQRHELHLKREKANDLLKKTATDAVAITSLSLDLWSDNCLENNRSLFFLTELELLGLRKLELKIDGIAEDADHERWMEQANLLSDVFLQPAVATNLTTLTFHLAPSLESPENWSRRQALFREPLRRCENLVTLDFSECSGPLPPLLPAALAGNRNLRTLSIKGVSNGPIQIVLPVLEELHATQSRWRTFEPEADGAASPLGTVKRLALTGSEFGWDDDKNVIRMCPQIKELAFGPDCDVVNYLPHPISAFFHQFRHQTTPGELKIWHWSVFRPQDLMEAVQREVEYVYVCMYVCIFISKQGEGDKSLYNALTVSLNALTVSLTLNVGVEEEPVDPRELDQWTIIPECCKPQPRSWLVFRKGRLTVRVSLKESLHSWADITLTTDSDITLTTDRHHSDYADRTTMGYSHVYLSDSIESIGSPPDSEHYI